MLDRFKKNAVVIICDGCGQENTHDISNRRSEYMIDGQFAGFYKDLLFECECGQIESFNMNLPTVDQDVPLEHQEKKEQKQKPKVNQLIMMVREDYTR